MKELPISDKADLVRLKGIITKGTGALISMAKAATEIQQRKLYLLESNTWEEFCRKNWGWTRQRVHQMISAAVVVEELPPALSTMVDNERVAREIAKIPKSKREEAVKVVAEKGPVTARAIKDQAKSVKEAEEVFRDEVGNKIPGPAIPFWNRRQEIQDLLTQISRIKCLVEKALEEGDPLFAKLGNGFLDHMKPAHYEISKIKHYAVCTACFGTFVNGCAFCGNSGLISKIQWDRDAAKEKKAIMLKTHLE